MSFFTWWTQRAGALSIFCLLALSYYVVSREAAAAAADHESAQISTESGDETLQQQDVNVVVVRDSGAGTWTFVFAYYSLFIHILVTFFPIRACWAVWQLTNTLKRASKEDLVEEWNSRHKDLETSSRVSARSDSGLSQPSDDTLAESRPSSTWSDDTVDIELDENVGEEGLEKACVVHAIVIPNYKEEIDVLRETLDVLASHPRARTCYDVYLGMEEREVEGTTKALSLIQQFSNKFRFIDFTSHPGDIPGEAAGKGSNLGWAARKLSANYAMGQRRDVIITGIDADSHLSATYFSKVASMHLSEPETALETLYSAPVIFDRNAHQVSALVRVADIVWCAAGLSGLYKGSTIAPPTSVYSIPLELVDRVGGWDCDGEAIGEDLHMYIKCFFALNGNLTCKIVPSPISSSNVSGGGKGGIRGSLGDIRARYKQALRHMWGALDTGFAIRKGVEMWRERKRTTRAFRPLHRSHGDDATTLISPDTAPSLASGMLDPLESGIFAEITHVPLDMPHLEHIFYLYLRLFEAHFLPVHMAILVISSALYIHLLGPHADPKNLLWTFYYSKILRAGSFMLIGCYIFLYESYHRVCVTTRHREMVKAGLAEGMCFSYRSLRGNLVDYFLVPAVAPLYGTIPSFQAEMSHLWTTDLVYTVSKKAVRQRARSVDASEMA